MPTKLYKVIVCRVGEEPKVEEVKSPFQFTSQELLGGGFVEMTHLDDGVIIYSDEEGRLKNLPRNRDIPTTAHPVDTEATFVIEIRDPDDPPFAKPGEAGYHRIYGNFLLGRHDLLKDKPKSLTEEDIKKYMVILKSR